MKGRVALLVDDSPETLSLLNDALEHTGLNVLLALDGQQALMIAQRMQPDIILMDALMPHLDGFETCRRFKAQAEFADTPVIFMTGLSDADSVVQGFDAGGVDYLTKPINTDELIARIRVHLGNAQRTQTVQNVLAQMGRNLFSLDAHGRELWVSPQAGALLHASGLQHDKERHGLYNQLGHWMVRKPLRGQKLRISVGETDLDVVLLSNAEDEQLLFKLLELDDEQTTGLLQRVLPLTERESEVLYWIANGKSNREIAEILSMSPRTVNKHLETIFPKLGVENRTAAAAIAIRVLESA